MEVMCVSYIITRYTSYRQYGIFAVWNNNPKFLIVLEGSESIQYFPEYGKWDCE